MSIIVIIFRTVYSFLLQGKLSGSRSVKQLSPEYPVHFLLFLAVLRPLSPTVVLGATRDLSFPPLSPGRGLGSSPSFTLLVVFFVFLCFSPLLDALFPLYAPEEASLLLRGRHHGVFFTTLIELCLPLRSGAPLFSSSRTVLSSYSPLKLRLDVSRWFSRGA